MTHVNRLRLIAYSATSQLLLPGMVLAQESSNQGGGSGPSGFLNPLQIGSVIELLNKMLAALQIVAVPIAVGFIAYAGFLYVTARGDSGQLETAKKALLWAIVGLAIIFAARILSVAIENSIK